MALKKILPLCVFSFLTAWAQNGFIVIDQFGYRPNAKKIAVIRSPQEGSDAPSSYTPGGIFQVINESSGQSVFDGSPEAFREGATDAASGDKIWWFDFSSLKEPGTYHVKDVSKNEVSFSFKIANDVYNNVLKAAIKMFYYQRAGTSKPAEYAGTSWADATNFSQDTRTRDFFDKNNASKERDLSGNWFDAGDYNKYTKWTADYIETMLLTYEENPKAFADDYGIPESGNGVPDIIDEVKWGISWLLKMQNSDGSVLSVQGLGTGSPPSSVTETSYYGPPSTTATLGATKAFAIASRLFNSFGETAYAEDLKNAAIKAWNWAEVHPDSIFHNNCGDTWNKSSCPNYDSRGLAAGDQELSDSWDRVENRINAAFSLYEITRADSLLEIFENNLKELPLYAWGSVMQQYRHAQHLLYMRYLESPYGTASVKSDMRSKLETAFAKAGDYYAAYQNDGYRSFIYDYQWGSNKVKTDYGLTFYKWDIVKSSADYKDIAEDYIHYIHGVNPFNMVYLTNMNSYGATKSLTTIYHTWFSEESNKWSATTSSNPGPAPGYLPGGPNENYAWDGCCPSSCGEGDGWSNNEKCYAGPSLTNQPPAKMYAEFNSGWPVNSWEVTEPSNGYQLSYIRLLSKFVEQKGTDLTPIKKDIKVGNSIIASAHLNSDGLVVQSVKAIDEIVLFNLKRNIVASHFNGGTEVRLNLNLPAGMYYLMVKSGSEVMVKPIAVVK